MYRDNYCVSARHSNRKTLFPFLPLRISTEEKYPLIRELISSSAFYTILLHQIEHFVFHIQSFVIKFGN